MNSITNRASLLYNFLFNKKSENKNIEAAQKIISSAGKQSYSILEAFTEKPTFVPNLLEQCGFNTLVNLSEISKSYAFFTKSFFISEANKYGYEGDDYQEALEFLNIRDLLQALLDEQVIDKNSLHRYKIQFKLYQDGQITDLKIDTDLIKKFYNKALYHCAHYGNTKLAQILIKKGADPNFTTREWNHSAFHEACRVNEYEMVQLLLEHGADMHSLNWQAKTPIEIARLFKSEDIIPLLSKYQEIKHERYN